MNTFMHGKGESKVLAGFICLFLLSPACLSAQPVLDVIHNHTEITIFAATIEQAGLDSRLNSGGPYTIFAPSNKALQQIKDRLDRNSTAGLERFILNHVLTGMATKRQIKAMSKAPSLGGLVLRMDVDSQDNVRVNNISVVEYNIRANNGIIDRKSVV